MASEEIQELWYCFSSVWKCVNRALYETPIQFWRVYNAIPFNNILLYVMNLRSECVCESLRYGIVILLLICLHISKYIQPDSHDIAFIWPSMFHEIILLPSYLSLHSHSSFPRRYLLNLLFDCLFLRHNPALSEMITIVGWVNTFVVDRCVPESGGFCTAAGGKESIDVFQFKTYIRREVLVIWQ